jgi:hypothetical protein
MAYGHHAGGGYGGGGDAGGFGGDPRGGGGKRGGGGDSRFDPRYGGAGAARGGAMPPAGAYVYAPGPLAFDTARPRALGLLLLTRSPRPPAPPYSPPRTRNVGCR